MPFRNAVLRKPVRVTTASTLAPSSTSSVVTA
jgi:hypothetical protein